MVKFSFLLPTRGRPELAARFFESIIQNTARIQDLEIVLAVDEDDFPSHAIDHPQLNIRKTILPPGTRMGRLNQACYENSSGRYVMLINDDVIIRTPNWDSYVEDAFSKFPDDIALIHVNDLLFEKKLCTFPFLSRRACEAIGVCPAEYKRYRIDDHIYDIYQMLAYLGHERIIYLPDVVFEHDNFQKHGGEQLEHTFKSENQKVYVPDQAIIKEDAHLFDRLFEQRKKDASTLFKIIENHPADQGNEIHERLNGLHDSYSYRRDHFVQTQFCSNQTEVQPRVTVGVVTSSIQKDFARTCLEKLKQHTSNFDLIILDNNETRDFNHPREMNKILGMAQTDYVVLMDDDVFVEEGWLPGLLKALDEETGVVAPMHKDGHGNFSFSGVYLLGDEYGTHFHHHDIPPRPRPVHALCSAIILIDMKKCGSLRFDTAYNKYFLDIDFSLQVWEAGYKTVCTPEVLVTHLGGATLQYGSQENHVRWNRDLKVFHSMWGKTGRLNGVRRNAWKQVPELSSLSDFKDRVDSLLCETNSLEVPQFQEELTRLEEFSRSLTLLQSYLAQKLRDQIPELEPHPEKSELCKQALRSLKDVPNIPIGFFPVLLESAPHHNLVEYNDRFYAIPLALGPWNLTNKEEREHPDVLSADSMEELKSLLENLTSHLASSDLKTRLSWNFLSILDSIKSFLNRRYGNSRFFITAIRPILRPIYLAGVSVFRKSTARPASPDNRTTPTVKFQMAYKGYYLVQNHNKWLGIPFWKRPRNLEPHKALVQNGALAGPKLSAVKTKIDKLDSKKQSPAPPTATLIEPDYNGFQLFHFATKYFAIPPGEPFDVDRIRGNGYCQSLTGATLEEIKNEVNLLTQNSRGQLKMLILGTPGECLAEHLCETHPDWTIHLIPSTRDNISHPETIHVREETLNPEDPFPAPLIKNLKTLEFDQVVLPFKDRLNWNDQTLEQLASKLSNRMVYAFASGASKTYKGEDIHRILYNKAYLASLFKWIPTLKDKKILDIGCADGLVCDLLATENPERVVGIDVLDIVGCGYPGPRVHYYKMNGEALSFNDEEFDVCLTIATLEHVQDPFKVLTEMKRVLKRGGIGYAQAAPLYHSPFGHHMFGYFDQEPWIHLRMSPGQIAELAGKNGVAGRIEAERATSVEHYVNSMIHPDHVNGLFLSDYRLEEFMNSPDIEVLSFQVSKEGEDLLSPELLKELKPFNPTCLTEHGFELVFRRA